MIDLSMASVRPTMAHRPERAESSLVSTWPPPRRTPSCLPPSCERDLTQQLEGAQEVVFAEMGGGYSPLIAVIDTPLLLRYLFCLTKSGVYGSYSLKL